MTPKAFSFRIRTGQWDAHGELCILFIGGRPEMDKDQNFIWMTNPVGVRVLRVRKDCVEKLSKKEANAAIYDELKLAQQIKAGPKN